MRIKKLMLIFSVAASFGAISTPIEVKSKPVNETISVNNEKINLRQKAEVKKVNSSSANIETTNVDYDLRYLYGGEKNYLNYDIWDLVPNVNNSKDTSFKFLCAKPVGNNLYLYLYHNDNKNSDILSSTFKISKSKTQNKDTGLFEESYSLYNARFINSYGYKGRFMKFAIDNIINTSEDIRCYIDSGYITYLDSKTNKKYFSNEYIIQDEFAFNVGSSSDFIYEYLKNDYVKITDKEVSLMLLNKDTLYNYDDYYYTNYENFYCFFNTDKNIDELIEIQYDYQFLEYEVESLAVRAKTAPDSMPTTYPKMHNVYKGLYNDFDKTKNLNREIYNFEDRGIYNIQNQKVTNTTTSYEVERPYFLWWKQNVKVSFDNLINCNEVMNNTSSEYKPLKDFVTNVNTKRSKNNKEQFKWGFKVTSSVREVTKGSIVGGWWNGVPHMFSTCHEVKQTMITWLKFRTNNQLFEFNCLDIPTDTSSIYLVDVPYDTLTDVVVDKVINGWDWLKTSLNNVKTNLIPVLILFMTIILIITCLPILTSISKIIGNKITSISKKKNNKRSNE